MTNFKDIKSLSQFDSFSHDYDSVLNGGLAITGETKEYFINGRIKFLADLLKKIHYLPESILDFGCGTGSAIPYFKRYLNIKNILGVDISSRSIEIARKNHWAANIDFKTIDEFQPNNSFDLVFTNGVFHHIPLPERVIFGRYIYQSLSPGGIFAFWENNPLNLGTRWVMKRIEFDRIAEVIYPFRAHSLLTSCGFQILRTDFMFIFPIFLKFLRGMEKSLSRLPLGGQYQILCRKN